MAIQSPIKVGAETKERIRYLAALVGTTQAEVVDAAVAEYAATHGDEIARGMARARSVLSADRRAGRQSKGLSLRARVEHNRHEVVRIAAGYGLTNLRLFGSAARGDENDNSDIDLLVDVAPGVGLLTMARCEHELEALLDAQVDLIPAADLKAGIDRSALADAIEL